MMGRNECLFPGSFDPVTNGHMDIIRRASVLYDKVYVGVLHNPDKLGCFPVEKRLELLKKACADLPNVEAIAFDGLLADLVRRLNVRAVVRGVRTVQDWESEAAMARINKRLNPALETVILPASPECEQISASIVRQIAGFGGDLSSFVPEAILGDVQAQFSK